MGKRKGDSVADSDLIPTKKSCQQFLPKYAVKYPVLQASIKGETFAFCTICSSNFMVSHGGLADCKRHVEGDNHVKFFNVRQQNQSLTSMMGKSVSKK